jgi:hypothetical protein
MVTRQYDIISGVETDTLPAPGTPTVSEDIVSKGYADTTYATAARFDPSTGHDHDGTDSKKVLATNLDATGSTSGQVVTSTGAGTAPSWQDLPAAQRSEIRLDTSGSPAYGSTNTKIRNFTTVTKDTGTAKGTWTLVATHATNGMSVTILQNGLYSIEYQDDFATAATLGLTRNSSQLTTNINGNTAANILAIQTAPAANYFARVTAVLELAVSDVIRAHTDGQGIGAGARAMFRIVKLSA